MAVNCKRLGVIVRIADPRGFIRFRGFDVFGMVTFLDCQRLMCRYYLIFTCDESHDYELAFDCV